MNGRALSETDAAGEIQRENVDGYDGLFIWGHHTYLFIAIMATRGYSRGMARLARVSVGGTRA